MNYQEAKRKQNASKTNDSNRDKRLKINNSDKKGSLRSTECFKAVLFFPVLSINQSLIFFLNDDPQALR